MKNLKIEMPVVKDCLVENCGFNNRKHCHAKAITIGDERSPGCDTFFSSDKHTHEKLRAAGVGACKVSECIHNVDFECTADEISVGMVEGQVECQTFHSR